MNKTANLAILTAIAFATAGSTAFACGESIFHTGHAMRYHAFITRRPARILVYDPGEWKKGVQQAEIYSGLESAGHKVTVSGDPKALKQALAARSYDVIIASSNDMATIRTLLRQPAPEPTLVAIIDRNAAQNAQLLHRYPRNLPDNANLNQYLKSIEQTMETRGT